MKIVIDTGFISSLFKINRLELVKKLFCVEKIYIPNAVLTELSKSKFFNDFTTHIAPNEEEVDDIHWIIALYATPIDDQEIGLGEREAISLARDLNAILLIDDRIAKDKATGIPTFDLSMFLKDCKEKGLIDREEMIIIIKELKEKDFYEY